MTCIDILFGSDDNPRTPEPAQIDRVAGWFEQAMAQAKKPAAANSLVASSAWATCASGKDEYSEAKN